MHTLQRHFASINQRCYLFYTLVVLASNQLLLYRLPTSRFCLRPRTKMIGILLPLFISDII